MDPAAEFEHARLIVEREECDVDGTCRTELGRRRPEHSTSVVDQSQTSHVLAGKVVGAENT